MLNILFKAILIYSVFRLAKGIYNGYQLSKKIRGFWNSHSNPPPPKDDPRTFEARYRHLDDE